MPTSRRRRSPKRRGCCARAADCWPPAWPGTNTRARSTPYGHVNLGFTEKELRKFALKAGLAIQVCEVVTREKRPPHFEVLTLLARKQ